MLQIRVRNKIGDILKEKDKSQIWLIRKLCTMGYNFDRTRMSRWVNNEVQPNVAYLYLISIALDVEMNDIIEEVKK